jgi:hypothetical protein
VGHREETPTARKTRRLEPSIDTRMKRSMSATDLAAQRCPRYAASAAAPGTGVPSWASTSIHRISGSRSPGLRKPTIFSTTISVSGASPPRCAGSGCAYGGDGPRWAAAARAARAAGLVGLWQLRESRSSSGGQSVHLDQSTVRTGQIDQLGRFPTWFFRW